jgi:hypothetical protein
MEVCYLKPGDKTIRKRETKKRKKWAINVKKKCLQREKQTAYLIG